jgi:FixJ family two-component response regulator
MSSTLLGVGDHGSAGGSGAVMSLVCSDSKWKATGKTPLVAIVDDDIWVRKSLQRLMKSAGFQTRAFASAEDFLESYNRDETACIILDFKLPKMSGLELQGHLAAEHSLVPIIFVSGNSEPETRSQALLAGAVAFLEKPFGDEALLNAVHSVLK